MERQLLSAALRSRNSYTLIQDKVSPEAKNRKDVRYTPEFRIIMEMVGKYYDRDGEATHVNKDLLGGMIDAAVANDKHKEKFKSIVGEALSSDTSVPNINALIRTALRHEIGGKLALKMANREDVSEEELEEYRKTLRDEDIEEEDDGVLRADSLAEALRQTLAGERGLSLYPPALSSAIGPRGLQPGSHVVIYGRPEISKSGFCITNAARWAMAGKRVLYFINEDPGVNIQLRILCCITGWTEEKVLADVDRATELANSRGFDNVVIKELHPGTSGEIDAWIEKEKPDAIIVDQLRNLWAKADSRANQLDQVARDVRDLAKKHGIVGLSVSQAGETAEGKAVLGMTDLDNSKTGIPGACDVLIGIGATQEHVATGYRVLTLSKNKVNGNHDSLTVRFIPQLSRYVDV